MVYHFQTYSWPAESSVMMVHSSVEANVIARRRL